MNTFHYWAGLLALILLRYFLIAGIAFFIFYKLFRNRYFFRKIQARFPKITDYRREIGYSIITTVIFSIVPIVFLFTPLKSVTQLYDDPATHGRLWYWLAFPLMFVVHDAYFYWTHRLMHHKKLFKLFHLVHHRSTNPSPWAALAFHPLEAVVEAGIFPVLLIIMPLTSLHLLVFFLLMMMYNVYGHLGYELYPKGMSRHRIGKWINTSINHNQHHQFFTGNYGLYFLWWDRWMGTIRPDYEARYEEIADKKPH